MSTSIYDLINPANQNSAASVNATDTVAVDQNNVILQASISQIATQVANPVAQIANATNPDAGTLTGAELVTVSRGAGVLQRALSGIGAWVVQTYLGFTQSGTGAVARTVQSKLRDFISLLDFGAKGDGVTDDGSILASISTTAQVPGSKTFYSASTINLQTVDLGGTGVSSLIKAPLQLSANTVLRNLSVSTGAGRSVQTSSSGVRIENSDITNTVAPAVAFSGANNITGGNVRNSRITTPNYGVLLDTTGYTGGTKISAVGNDIQSVNADAIEWNAPGAGFTGTIASLNFLSNSATTGSGSAGFGVGIAAAKYNVVSGNVILASRLEQIHIEDSQRGTVISANTGTGLYNGIRILNANAQNSLPVSIVGNAFENSNATPTAIGIELFWTTPGTLSGNAIVANVLNNYAEGISVGGSASGAINNVQLVYGNSILNATYGMTGWGSSNQGTVRQVGTNLTDTASTLFYSKSKSILFGKIVSKTRPTNIMANAGNYSGTLPSRCDGFEFPLSAAISVSSSAGGQTLFVAGGPFRGRVKFQAKSAGSATDWCHISADVMWDGTTLTISNTLSRIAGVITSISITSSGTNGSNPYVNIRSSSNTTLQVGWVEFEGEYWDQ